MQKSKKKMKSTRYKFQCEISEFMKCCWDKKLCTGRSKQNQFLKIKNNIKFINSLQICDPELYCSLKIEYVLLIFNGCLKWMIKQILNLKQGIRLVCNLKFKILKSPCTSLYLIKGIIPTYNISCTCILKCWKG